VIAVRTVVAIIEARPETIAEDYRRLLDLSGIPAPNPVAGPITLAAQAAPDGWFPGAGSPPWQLAGLLDHCGPQGSGSRVKVAAVDPLRGSGNAAGWGWDDVIAARGAALVDDSFWTGRPWRPAAHLPGLSAAAGAKFEIPAGLTGPGTLGLLAVPSLDPAWAVAGATRLLLSMVPGILRRPRKLPRDTFLTESLAYAREVLAARTTEGAPGPAAFAVLDGVVWEVGPGLRGRGPVARNVLIAGVDPVAVDAVAVRLSGVDPTRVPWLRAVEKEGLGTVNPRDIRLTGQADLVDHDFERPSVGMEGATVRWPWLADLSWRLTRRRAILRRHRGTPWGRLFEEYRNAENRGEGP
jgi:hypothetical protein